MDRAARAALNCGPVRARRSSGCGAARPLECNGVLCSVVARAPCCGPCTGLETGNAPSTARATLRFSITSTLQASALRAPFATRRNIEGHVYLLAASPPLAAATWAGGARRATRWQAPCPPRSRRA